MNLKPAALVTSLLESTRTLTKRVTSYWPRVFNRSGLRLVRDPIEIQEPLAGALARADGFPATPRTEAEALSRANAWTDVSPSERVN